MQFYDLPMDAFEKSIAADIQEKIKLSFTPYVVKGSDTLREQVAKEMISGNTVTTPGFYAPQGRQVRIAPRYPKLLEDLNYYHNKNSEFWLTNFEMETAAYYAFGRMLGHEMLSVNAIIANRIKNKFAKDPDKVVDSLIKKVLNAI
jgi:uridine phosphorylase